MSEQLQNLFSSEAVATYIVFIAGIVVASVGWLISRYINRKRPQKIKLVRINEKSLLEISSELRDQVKVLYKDRETNSIFFTEFQLQNSGDEVVENVKLIVRLDNATILGSSVNDPILDRRNPHEAYFEHGNLRIELPYVNSKRLYNDIITFEILSESPLKVIEVQGGGREWIASLVDLVGLENQLRTELKSIKISVGIAGTVEVIADYLVHILPLLIRIRRSQK